MSTDGAPPADALSPEDARLLASIPSPPREVPSWFRRKQLFGTVVIIGAVFASIGLVMLGVGAAMVLGRADTFGSVAMLAFGLVFAAAGVAVFRKARRTGKRHVRAMERGTAVLANVTSSELDTSVTVNGSNPWKITYVFFIDDISFHGSLSTWNVGQAETIAKGARVGVVYLEDSPKVNCLYPPL